MSIAFISAAISRNTATLNHVVTLPASTVSGSVIVASIAWNGGPGTVTWPAGWTVMPGTASVFGVPTNPQASVAYHVCDGTEGASITVTSTSSVISGHAASAYSGVDNTTPIDVNATTAGSATAGTTDTATNITTVTNNAWVIGGAMSNGSTGSFTTGWTTPTGTERCDVQNGQASGSGKNCTQSDSNAAFATGTTATITWTSSTSLAWIAWLTALRPASGGGGAARQQTLTLLGAGA